MKRIFCILLICALVLSGGTSAIATDNIDDSGQPQESENQTTVTVGTLEELETAIAAAEDGDTIAISAEITLDGVALETDSDITIARADTYESGSFFRLKNSAVLSGFTMENYESSTTVVCESAAEIKHCSFIGDVETTESFIKAYMLFSKAGKLPLSSANSTLIFLPSSLIREELFLSYLFYVILFLSLLFYLAVFSYSLILYIPLFSIAFWIASCSSSEIVYFDFPFSTGFA